MERDLKYDDDDDDDDERKEYLDIVTRVYTAAPQTRNGPLDGLLFGTERPLYEQAHENCIANEQPHGEITYHI